MLVSNRRASDKRRKPISHFQGAHNTIRALKIGVHMKRRSATTPVRGKLNRHLLDTKLNVPTRSKEMASDTQRDLSLALVGDINLGSPIEPANVLDLVREDFDAFDVKICNLEGCLFDPDVLLQHKPGWRHC